MMTANDGAQANYYAAPSGPAAPSAPQPSMTEMSNLPMAFLQQTGGQPLAPGVYSIAPAPPVPGAQGVQYVVWPQPSQPLQPAAPMSPGAQGGWNLPVLPTIAVSAQGSDSEHAMWSWLLYGLGWLCCCCIPFCTPLIWLGVAAWFYCKPAGLQSVLPQQRLVAKVTVVTCFVTTIILLCCLLFAAGVAIGHDPDFMHTTRVPKKHMTTTWMGLADPVMI